ncbi:MAG: hypothetical protein H6739_31135 [Alphaproteobacteria bacterium]|nr:hypothetical protein [Alphaproteobacteria bacterium]
MPPRLLLIAALAFAAGLIAPWFLSSAHADTAAAWGSVECAAFEVDVHEATTKNDGWRNLSVLNTKTGLTPTALPQGWEPVGVTGTPARVVVTACGPVR